MRKIKEMLRNNEKVWVYINDKDTWKEFTAMAASEGFRFGELPTEMWNFGHIVAVHNSGELGHIPLYTASPLYATVCGQTSRVIFSPAHSGLWSLQTI